VSILWRSEQLGQVGVFACIELVQRRGPRADLAQVVAELAAAGIRDPEAALRVLQSLGLLTQVNNEEVSLSQAGRRTRLLLAGVNQVLPMEDVVRGLAAESAALPHYYLVTDMTEHFIMNLYQRPDFGRVYICSPWLSFEPATLQYLVHALALASRSRPAQIYVVTRRAQAQAGITALRNLGADITFRDDLHTKLYIRDPGRSGGLLLSILGSQNLTRSAYLELGLVVRNDSVIISRLIAYFFTLRVTREA
jgi:hypothetical protein